MSNLQTYYHFKLDFQKVCVCVCVGVGVCVCVCVCVGVSVDVGVSVSVSVGVGVGMGVGMGVGVGVSTKQMCGFYSRRSLCILLISWLPVTSMIPRSTDKSTSTA